MYPYRVPVGSFFLVQLFHPQESLGAGLGLAGFDGRNRDGDVPAANAPPTHPTLQWRSVARWSDLQFMGCSAPIDWQN